MRQLSSQNAFQFHSSLAFSPNGRTLATAGVIETVTQKSPNFLEYRHLGEIQLFSVDSGVVESHLIRRHPDPFTSLLFSKDGQTLAAGCGDCGIYLWQIAAAR